MQIYIQSCITHQQDECAVGWRKLLSLPQGNTAYIQTNNTLANKID